jgi:ribosomal-protein-alanine N-acetyltransferase
MIELKKVKLSDASKILLMHKEGLGEYYLSNLTYSNIDEVKKEIKRFKKMNEKGLAYIFIILKDKKFAGTIDIWKINKKNFRTCVGYAVKKEFRGKGVASTALKKALKFIKEEMKMHAVEATAHPKNIASQKVLLKNGFTKIGLMKDYHFDNEKFVDRVLYWKVFDNKNKILKTKKE